MIICLCHRVSDRDIARAAREGCRSFEALQNATRVGTACGNCLCCARVTFDEQLKAAALPTPPLQAVLGRAGTGVRAGAMQSAGLSA